MTPSTIQKTQGETVLWNDWPISALVLAIPRSSPPRDYRRIDGVDPSHLSFDVRHHRGTPRHGQAHKRTAGCTSWTCARSWTGRKEGRPMWPPLRSSLGCPPAMGRSERLSVGRNQMLFNRAGIRDGASSVNPSTSTTASLPVRAWVAAAGAGGWIVRAPGLERSTPHDLKSA